MYASAAMVALNRGLGELRAHQKRWGFIGFAKSINRHRLTRGPIVGFGRGRLATHKRHSLGNCEAVIYLFAFSNLNSSQAYPVKFPSSISG